jgi:hypothetical protein
MNWESSVEKKYSTKHRNKRNKNAEAEAARSLLKCLLSKNFVRGYKKIAKRKASARGINRNFPQ